VNKCSTDNKIMELTQSVSSESGLLYLLYTIHRVRKKSLQFSLHNFNRFRRSFVNFDVNHSENSFH